MNEEQIRDQISETFRNRDGARIVWTLLQFLHAWVNFFVEILRPKLPWEVPFIGNDRNPWRLRIRRRALGYWIGHLASYVVLVFALAALGEISRSLVLWLF